MLPVSDKMKEKLALMVHERQSIVRKQSEMSKISAALLRVRNMTGNEANRFTLNIDEEEMTLHRGEN